MNVGQNFISSAGVRAGCRGVRPAHALWKSNDEHVGTAAPGCPAARKYRAAAQFAYHQIHDALKSNCRKPTPT